MNLHIEKSARHGHLPGFQTENCPKYSRLKPRGSHICSAVNSIKAIIQTAAGKIESANASWQRGKKEEIVGIILEAISSGGLGFVRTCNESKEKKTES